MPRYLAIIEYDGTPYSGWQAQENAPSVQAVFEAALKAMTNEEVTVFAAGRTDAGVHATGQAAHFDLSKDWSANRLSEGLNHHLKPAPVAAVALHQVADNFHARFSANSRHYLYRIINRRPELALERNRAWRVPVVLDAEAMHRAAQRLVGHHDFTTFRAAGCQAKSPMKTLDHLSVARRDDLILIKAHSRSFLHSQVRSMVGSLKLVGQGKWSADDLEKALAARQRKACGPVAPPEGLYLTRVAFSPSDDEPLNGETEHQVADNQRDRE